MDKKKRKRVWVGWFDQDADYRNVADFIKRKLTQSPNPFASETKWEKTDKKFRITVEEL